MRIAVAVFFVLCAIFLFVVSLQAELTKEGLPHHKHGPPAHHGHPAK